MRKRRQRNLNDIAEITIQIGTGRKGTQYKGSIYSKKFWESLRVIIQKHHGNKLPKEFEELTKPIRED